MGPVKLGFPVFLWIEVLQKDKILKGYIYLPVNWTTIFTVSEKLKWFWRYALKTVFSIYGVSINIISYFFRPSELAASFEGVEISHKLIPY